MRTPHRAGAEHVSPQTTTTPAGHLCCTSRITSTAPVIAGQEMSAPARFTNGLLARRGATSGPARGRPARQSCRSTGSSGSQTRLCSYAVTAAENWNARSVTVSRHRPTRPRFVERERWDRVHTRLAGGTQRAARVPRPPRARAVAALGPPRLPMVPQPDEHRERLQEGPRRWKCAATRGGTEAGNAPQPSRPARGRHEAPMPPPPTPGHALYTYLEGRYPQRATADWLQAISDDFQCPELPDLIHESTILMQVRRLLGAARWYRELFVSMAERKYDDDYLRGRLGFTHAEARVLRALVFRAVEAGERDISTRDREQLLSRAKELGRPCELCGGPIDYFDRTAFNSFSLDHVWPQALGGTSDRSNLRIACRRCNEQRSS
jgi:hypothetical protein